MTVESKFIARAMWALTCGVVALIALSHGARAVGTADGSVPIGTSTAPASQLGVYGNVSIGSSYQGTAAPANGAIVQGNVGIGSTNPQQPLDVSGPVKVSGTGSEVCDAAHLGSIRFNPTTHTAELCFVH